MINQKIKNCQKKDKEEKGEGNFLKYKVSKDGIFDRLQ